MKKISEQKVVVVVLALAGLVALVLLSAALRDLSFREPDPFSFNLSALMILPTAVNNMDTDISGWRYIMFIALLAMIFAIIMFFLDPELRKRILKRMLRMILAMASIFLLLNYAFENGSLKKLLQDAALVGAAAESGKLIQAEAPTYVPPQISPWLVFAVSFAIGLLLVLVVWYIYSRRFKYSTGVARNEVAGIAREALEGLQPGRNWDDAIVRAYVRMNEVVVAERGLLRQPGSTPREFAERMERIGLPGEAVRVLTRLFEGVRYGAVTSSPAERDQAAAALSAILHFCGRNQ